MNAALYRDPELTRFDKRTFPSVWEAMIARDLARRDGTETAIHIDHDGNHPDTLKPGTRLFRPK